MQGLEAALGAAVLAVVAWDLFAAVLHPSARGLVARTVWRVLRALAPVRGGRRLLTFAGPVAILGNLLGSIFERFNGARAFPTTAFYDRRRQLEYTHIGAYATESQLNDQIRRYIVGA